MRALPDSEHSEPPVLTVVVPTHGRLSLFYETLASLERQTLASFELVVTDDSATAEERRHIQDATLAYGRRTGRPARYLFSAPNLGQPRNTNQGLGFARGTFVRILHSDDLLAPHALETEVAVLSDPDADLSLLIHDCERFTTAPRFDGQPALTLVQPALFFRTSMHSSTPLPSATVFRRTLLEEVGPLREDYAFVCDWDLLNRLIAAEQRHNRFIARLSIGLVGWRAHDDSTTGQLWDRHFLEHERLMEAMRQDEALASELIGDADARERFFEAAVRYRYRRLAQDLAPMTWRRLWQARARVLRCLRSTPSLAARLRRTTTADASSRTSLARRLRAWPGRIRAVVARPADPRAGLLAALKAHAAARIITWGRAHLAARQAPGATAVSTEPVATAAAVDAISPPDAAAVPSRLSSPLPSAIEIDSHHGAYNRDTSVVRILTDYNNTTNFWSIRRLIARADTLVVHDVNINAFVEPVLHQALTFTSVGTALEIRLDDNAHLTAFGCKALLERMAPRQFAWVDQSKAGTRHTLRYERRAEGHRTYSAPHTGWTFGMLTTGKRLENVERFVESVERHCRDPYEILIVSPVALPTLEHRPRVQVLHFDERDDLGWITRKKNLICARAAYSDILVCHDRFTLAPGFSRHAADWGYAYGLAAVRVQLPDGRRGLDWGVVSSQNLVLSSGGLLDYRAYSQYVYVPGGATLLRKAFWQDFPWNENLFWNEHEDVELCRRVQRAGGIIRLSLSTVIAAEDRWIHLNPHIPFCDQHEVLYGRPVGEQRIRFIPKEKVA